ncbi:putative zinc transporter zrg17 [Clarias magur]|uniref:Putative zinc transporter zrg17 n=1 Tax=Clarias magur TaxID=1594786 RepID=A0A8J4TTM5_CLAMG|nr:putative zinc transporter zrg17 [Clarias magur]
MECTLVPTSPSSIRTCVGNISGCFYLSPRNRSPLRDSYQSGPASWPYTACPGFLLTQPLLVYTQAYKSSSRPSQLIRSKVGSAKHSHT